MTISAINASGFLFGSYGSSGTSNTVNTTTPTSSVTPSSDQSTVENGSQVDTGGSTAPTTAEESSVLSSSLLALIANSKGLPASATPVPAPTDPFGQALLNFFNRNQAPSEPSATPPASTTPNTPTTTPTPAPEAANGTTEETPAPAAQAYMQLPNGFRMPLFNNG